MKVNNLFYIIFFLFGFLLNGVFFGNYKKNSAKEGKSFLMIDKNECDALIFEEKAKIKKILDNSSKIVNYILLLDSIDTFKNNFYHKNDLFLSISEILSIINSDNTFLFLRKKYSFLNKQDVKSLNAIINIFDNEIKNKKFFGIALYSNKKSSDISLLIKARNHLRNNEINFAIEILQKLEKKEKYQLVLDELLKLRSVLQLCEEIKLTIKDKFNINYTEEF